jgi:hypothetical protein
MMTNLDKLIRIAGNLLLFMQFLIIASACTSIPDTPNPDPGAAPLPFYQKGMTFIYSDGSWETVTAVAPKTVAWRNDRGKISKGSPDFTYRQVEWQVDSRRGFREFKPRSNLLVQGRDTLWPLQVGNTVTYMESATWVDREGVKQSSQRHWACRVVGTEKVSVMAGEFETWKINCNRYKISRKKNNKSRLREARTWYYAPQIGHWVMVTSTYNYNKFPRHLELTAVLPPTNGLSAKTQLHIDNRFQNALESYASGNAMSWSIPGTNISGGTIPVGTYKMPNGTYCRRYVQTLTVSNNQKTYYGMACRDTTGQWTIPRR